MSDQTVTQAAYTAAVFLSDIPTGLAQRAHEGTSKPLCHAYQPGRHSPSGQTAWSQRRKRVETVSRKAIKRPSIQRDMNISFPLPAAERLSKWAGDNGCTEQLAVAVAVTRYAGKVAECPPPAKKGAPRKGQERVSKIVTLPLELQAFVDQCAKDHSAAVNMVIATAVEVGLK